MEENGKKGGEQQLKPEFPIIVGGFMAQVQEAGGRTVHSAESPLAPPSYLLPRKIVFIDGPLVL